ncbi:MAG: rhomboid family intramembrane serine protease [Alicyclobacillus mali]|uniref:rhomboid family intramembrane serine protease n=1 Tax=Alicyclobacillus mali (ex Roth et al. 2021) TaxID=1123961 RepID=UPI0023F03F1C|nr:rhomboid family intramembrane serine protease [Alicyclobacillus mali (ex Roth et al. 2021)]MCL6487347.1 rhomboid family intramembrane serine protease [Alicyclobacillus mali (ex Roth et al. 2021)]
MSRLVRMAGPWSRAPITWSLIAANVLWFVAVEGVHGLGIPGLVESGALDWPDVAVFGQWWRISSSMFVHLGIAHLAVNMVSLWSMAAVERILGRALFLVTYLVSGWFGNVLSLWLSPHNVVAGGASGAIFGVFGVALYLALRGYLTKAARNQMVAILVINLLFDVTNTHIGTLAHIGGLVAGAGVAALAVRFPQIRTQRPVRWLSIVLALVALGCLVLAVPGYSPALGA